MSNLPAELLDHIVDILHDSQVPLRNCCLVSKSWIPRTRRHLFAKIDFPTEKRLESWKKAFPDPPTSPACYTKALFIGRSDVVTDVDAEVGGWIGCFRGVEHLGLGVQNLLGRGWEVAFALLRGFSPVVKSIRIISSSFSFPHFFDLILSFPLLEDLSVVDCYDRGDNVKGPSTIVQPSSLPTFAGSLDLFMREGTRPIVHRLLSQPGSINFQKLTLKWFRNEDVSLTMALAERCSHTLESLDITCNSHLVPGSISFNLSKAIRLRDAVLRPGSLGVEWITLAIRSITPKHQELRRIWIDVPYFVSCVYTEGDVRKTVGDGIFEEWLDLDRVLVHLWESLSIRTRVRCTKRRRKGATGDYTGCLLPEMMKGGMVTVDLIE